MSDTKFTPERIWVDPYRSAPNWGKKPVWLATEYVRADIADDMYAALAEVYDFVETANEWFGRDAAGEAQVNASSAMHQKAFYVSERLSAALARARGQA